MSAGRITCAVVVNEDISGRNQAERQLHESLAEMRTLTGRLMRAQDDERRRIAQMLHETTAQDLAALKMHLARLTRTEAGLPDDDRAALAESIEVAERSMTGIRPRRILLHPPLLDEAGLLSAVRWYEEAFAGRSGVKVDLDLPATFGRLPQDVETALFRVVQEALINIHRHAASPSALIRVRNGTSGLTLEIEDHGRGMPPELMAQLPSGGGALGVASQACASACSSWAARSRSNPANAAPWFAPAFRSPPRGHDAGIAAHVTSTTTPRPAGGARAARVAARPGRDRRGDAGREAVELVRRLHPDVIVMDVSLSELNGLEATRQIAKESATEVLVLTMHHSEQLARDVLQAGARGYVMKSDADQSLIAAVESLRQHKPFLTSKVTEFVLDDYLRRGETWDEGALKAALTPREREIVQLLAEGNSNKETASALVSVKTIEAHRANIMRKTAAAVGDGPSPLRDPQQDRPAVRRHATSMSLLGRSISIPNRRRFRYRPFRETPRRLAASSTPLVFASAACTIARSRCCTAALRG